MAIELSEEDAYIIDSLQKGISQKEIANYLKKDESTVSKKIKDLKEAGIIVAYPSAIVDASKLVKLVIYGLIKLRLTKGGQDWEELARMISVISPKIVEVSALFGLEYDVMIKCYVDSIEEYYDDIVRKIISSFEIHGMTSFILFRAAKHDPRVPKECLNIKKVKS